MCLFEAMEKPELAHIESYIEGQILNLGLGITGRTSRRFGISKEESRQLYKACRIKIKRKARNRAFVYLLIGTPTIAAGVLGTFGDTGVILYGAILTGLAFILTSIGLFRLAF